MSEAGSQFNVCIQLLFEWGEESWRPLCWLEARDLNSAAATFYERFKAETGVEEADLPPLGYRIRIEPRHLRADHFLFIDTFWAHSGWRRRYSNGTSELMMCKLFETQKRAVFRFHNRLATPLFDRFKYSKMPDGPFVGFVYSISSLIEYAPGEYSCFWSVRAAEDPGSPGSTRLGGMVLAYELEILSAEEPPQG